MMDETCNKCLGLCCWLLAIPRLSRYAFFHAAGFDDFVLLAASPVIPYPCSARDVDSRGGDNVVIT